MNIIMSLAYYILDPNILLSLGTIKVFTISLNDPSLLFFKFVSVSFTFCSQILLPGWLVDNVPASASSSLSFAHSLQAENPDKHVFKGVLSALTMMCLRESTEAFL